MTKADLISFVAEQTGLAKKDAEKAVSSTIDGITEGMKKDGKVQIVGFGTFEVRTRAARVGTNPATKESINIPESKAPAFKAGKGLKDSVK